MDAARARRYRGATAVITVAAAIAWLFAALQFAGVIR